MSQDRKEFWNRRTYCLITGASQGIGRQISIEFAQKVAPGSTFLLVARNIDNLNETKRLMEEVSNDINIFVHSFNFYEPVGIELHKLIYQSLDMFSKNVDDFDLSMIVHNAGSIGDITELTHDFKNIEKLNSYFMLNLFSVCVLNAEFLKIFDAELRPPNPVDLQPNCEICIVNITSLCAIKPFASMGYYCVGKASREMFFSVMAEENKKYLILSYSPGPVKTDMIEEIVNNVRDEEVRKMFVNMKNDNAILTPEASVKKLVKVLAARDFKSGSRVDFYDFFDADCDA